jgi:hypothetical protein
MELICYRPLLTNLGEPKFLNRCFLPYNWFSPFLPKINKLYIYIYIYNPQHAIIGAQYFVLFLLMLWKLFNSLRSASTLTKWIIIICQKNSFLQVWISLFFHNYYLSTTWYCVLSNMSLKWFRSHEIIFRSIIITVFNICSSRFFFHQILLLFFTKEKKRGNKLISIFKRII